MRAAKVRIGALKTRIKERFRHRLRREGVDETEELAQISGDESDNEGDRSSITSSSDGVPDNDEGRSARQSVCIAGPSGKSRPREDVLDSEATSPGEDEEDSHIGPQDHENLTNGGQLWRQAHRKAQQDPEFAPLMKAYKRHMEKQGGSGTSASDALNIQGYARGKLAKLSDRQLSFQIGNRKVVVRD